MKSIHSFKGFASDNYSGIHPDIMNALFDANKGQAIAYGEDAYTNRLQKIMQSHLGDQAEVFPVFNGTGANVLSLQSMLPRWGAVICASTAHINVDENAAPERVGSIKLLPVETPDGKLTPELIAKEAWGWGDEHRAQPLAVSITQSTELGTCYSVKEIKAISKYVHDRGMLLHLDGARISNACVSQNKTMNEIITQTGVDIASIGGTKNGIMMGEMVAVINPGAAVGLKYLRKMNMQLASKMRYISAQLLALYENDLWIRNATNANNMAIYMKQELEKLLEEGKLVSKNGEKLVFMYPVEANAVFVSIPPLVASSLRKKGFRFYDWDKSNHTVRWMCSYDTTKENVMELVTAISECFQNS